MNNQPIKRLYRSEQNKVISGICGGLGEYFSVDAVILRLVYLLITIFTGVIPGILVYLLAVLIVPKKSHVFHEEPIHRTASSTTGSAKTNTEDTVSDNIPSAS